MALYSVFSQFVVIPYDFKKPEDKLMMIVLLKVWKKIYGKAIEQKKQHALKLEPEEALSFWLFFNRLKLPPELQFESNFIQTVNNSIHKNYNL